MERFTGLPLVLCIMDGWGVRKETEANAVAACNPEETIRLAARYPHLVLRASGTAVGVPSGQMGNSEVGHLAIGAGRPVEQIFTRSLRAVEERSLAGEREVQAALEAAAPTAQAPGRSLHLMGLVSDGGVHSHQALAEEVVKAAAARGLERVWVHAFLDGRDTPPKSALGYLERLQRALEAAGVGRVATVAGRYWAMDRDGNWERTEKAWRALVLGEGRRTADWSQAVKDGYERGETDEFVEPTVIGAEGSDPAPGRIAEGDAVVFFNFRADRARQITRALAFDEFEEFPRPGRPHLSRFTCFAPYGEDWDLPVVFSPRIPRRVLGEVLSEAGIRQVRIAETEKYAHVTYFFNGGREEVFDGEERNLIPSKKMKSYVEAPEMQADAVLEAAETALREDRDRMIVVNFANPDMVGHSGVMEAAVKACRKVDQCVGRLAVRVREAGGVMILTSDHGNAELMVDPKTGNPHTAHTTNPVPCILVWEEGRGQRVPAEAELKDLAPTILALLGLPVPEEMVGKSLVGVL
jgi:2,3-bisphosphoglycerate-independent phosphoglycerate mutase